MPQIFPNAMLKGCSRIAQQNSIFKSCTQRCKIKLKASDQPTRCSAISGLRPFIAQQKYQMWEEALAWLKKYSKL